MLSVEYIYKYTNIIDNKTGNKDKIDNKYKKHITEIRQHTTKIIK